MRPRTDFSVVIVGAFVVASAQPPARVGSPIALKSGAAMCGALTAADFAAVGIKTNAKPASNVNDNGASVYCVYAGKSVATGGVELDVFYPAGANAAESKATLETAVGEGGSPLTAIRIAGADEARWSPRSVSGGPAFASIAVRRSNLVFVLGIPAGSDAETQVRKLAALVLARF